MDASQSDPPFRRDLYAGAARDYERYRVPYPAGLISDLARQPGADGGGRVLVLACGTGQLSFALRCYFAAARRLVTGSPRTG
jgi:hypothetical protein